MNTDGEKKLSTNRTNLHELGIELFVSIRVIRGQQVFLYRCSSVFIGGKFLTRIS